MNLPYNTRLSVLLTLLIAAFATLLINPSPASAQSGPGVIYSYEQIQVGNTTQWALVPRVMSTSLTDDLESNLRASFKALRNAKPPTYGRSNLEVDPGQLKKGSVAVDIDDDKVKYQLIIEAEVTQTFAQFGIKQVVFKGGDAENTVRPGEVPFTTFTLTVPVWRALPPATLASGDVRFSDGEEMTYADFSSKLKEKDDRLVKKIYAELDRAQPLAQIGMLERMAGLKLPDYEEKVVGLLKDNDPSVRIAAIRALEGSNDSDALEALVAVVDKDKSDDVKAAAAGVLSKAKSSKYSAYGIYYALRGSDPDAALTAIDELVNKKVTEAGDELVKALANKDPRVGVRAATALREIGLDRELVGAVGNDKLDPKVQEQVAVEVASLSDKDEAFKGLSWLAAHGTESNAVDAIQKLARYKDPEPFDPLEKALQSDHPKARLAAASALAGLKEDDSLDAMADAARAFPDEGEEIEKQMVELLIDSESLSDLEDRTKKERDDLMKRATFRALGKKGADANRFKQIKDKLVEGLEDKSELARGGALIGLAYQPTDENLQLISPLASDSSAQVRRDVAIALANYPEGKATDVLARLAEDSEPAVAVAAINTFGKREESAVTKDMIKLAKGADTSVRRALLAATPKMTNEKNRADVVAFISNALFDDDKSVKKQAIASLGVMADSQSISSLALLVQDPDAEIRFATFDALAASQSPEAVSLLVQGLQADDAETRKRALEAMIEHGSITPRPDIEELLETETDPEVKKAAEKALEVLK